jgi:hypothetical protein
MLAEPNKHASARHGNGRQDETTDKMSGIRVPHRPAVAETASKLVLVKFKRLERATVQPFVRSEKAH